MDVLFVHIRKLVPVILFGAEVNEQKTLEEYKITKEQIELLSYGSNVELWWACVKAECNHHSWHTSINKRCTQNKIQGFRGKICINISKYYVDC